MSNGLEIVTVCNTGRIGDIANTRKTLSELTTLFVSHGYTRVSIRKANTVYWKGTIGSLIDVYRFLNKFSVEVELTEASFANISVLTDAIVTTITGIEVE